MARVPPLQVERRLPAAAGILIAMGGSIALWGAIYAACILRF